MQNDVHWKSIKSDVISQYNALNALEGIACGVIADSPNHYMIQSCDDSIFLVFVAVRY